MAIPSKQYVAEILSDFEIRLRRIVEDSWEEWLNIPDRGRFSDRSRASMIFDFIRRRALDEFTDDANIRAMEKGQTVHFLFNDRLLVRFKKANAAGVGSNIETQSVLEFIDPQLEIPDFLPEIYKVEICYHLNPLATDLSMVAVTARDRNNMVWNYDLGRDATGEVATLHPSSPPSVPPASVQIRKQGEKSKSEE